MPRLSRREFCVLTGAGVVGCACGDGAGSGNDLGIGKDLATAVNDLSAPASDLVDPTCPVGTTLHAGPAASYAVGSATFYACSRVFVVRDAAGLYAISSACTHENCDVHFNSAGPEFDCPCHGSIFDVNGNVIQNPATMPLPHFAVSLDGNGNVLVDLSTMVPPGTRLSTNGD